MNTNLTITSHETNPTPDTSLQTPIEIALKIDENGMTSLRNLYDFLELDKSHYKRWYTKNILKNDFATENIDYFVVSLEGEPKKYNPNPTLEFKLTTDFAKQLSMTVKNERGQEARQYFIACEQRLKVTSIEVAEMIDKEHNKLIRDIRRYINQLGEAKIGHTDFFLETTYVSGQNKELPCFNVTRKGCEFIANKLTGQKGTEFTARYVNKFHELEESNVTNALIVALNNISESMIEMKNNMTNLKTDIESRLAKLEQSQRNRYLLEKRYPSA